MVKNIFAAAVVLFFVLSCNKPMAPSQPYLSAAAVVTPTPAAELWDEVKPADFVTPRSGHSSVFFQNKLFLIAGAGDEGGLPSIAAYDGIKWVSPSASAGPSGYEYSAAAVFGGEIALTGGRKNGAVSDSVYYSPDGVSWTVKTNAGFGRVYGHCMETFLGRVFILGGLDGEKFRAKNFSSKDGIKFEEVKMPEGAEAFGERAFFSSAVFKGRLFAFAGRGPSGLISSVIFTEDGADWETATKSAAFGLREKHAMTSYKGRLWISGGVNEKNEPLGDLWWSEDGANWVSVTAKESYGARHSHTMKTVRDALFITGGESGGKKTSDSRRAK